MPATARSAEGDRLLEREKELGAVGAALDAARDGHGGLLVLEAEGGLGKSRLLAEIEHAAADAGLAVLRARGHDFETELALGLVVQLFLARIVRASPEERDALLS